MAQLLDSISEEEGDNLLSFVDPNKAAKTIKRDIGELVFQLESPPQNRVNLDKFSKDGELLKSQSKSRSTELAWAEVRSDILSFYTSVRFNFLLLIYKRTKSTRIWERFSSQGLVGCFGFYALLNRF